MKNENMVRTVVPVKRIIRFDNKIETVKLFITLYDHLFYRPKDKDAWNHNGYKICREPDHIDLWFTMRKADFDKIVKYLGLTKYSTQEWIYW